MLGQRLTPAEVATGRAPGEPSGTQRGKASTGIGRKRPCAGRAISDSYVTSDWRIKKASPQRHVFMPRKCAMRFPFCVRSELCRNRVCVETVFCALTPEDPHGSNKQHKKRGTGEMNGAQLACALIVAVMLIALIPHWRFMRSVRQEQFGDSFGFILHAFVAWVLFVLMVIWLAMP